MAAPLQWTDRNVCPTKRSPRCFVSTRLDTSRLANHGRTRGFAPTVLYRRDAYTTPKKKLSRDRINRTLRKKPTWRSTLPKKTGVLPYAPTERCARLEARTTIGKGAAWRHPYNGQTGMSFLRKDRHVSSIAQDCYPQKAGVLPYAPTQRCARLETRTTD